MNRKFFQKSKPLIHHKNADSSAEQQYLEINNVRITPRKLIFEDAFPGRAYKKEIVIQNLGSRIAIITLFTPTSMVTNWVHC